MNFNGEDIKLDIHIEFNESLQGIEKTLEIIREIKCHTCEGKKEAHGSRSSLCYSCKGEGIKKDPLFHKESKCNTCGGHGYLVKNPCKSCSGEGIVRQTFSKTVKIP